MAEPSDGITMAKAAADLNAALSAASCPTSHSGAVAVQTLDGETVAALCPACDRQLPAAWATPPSRETIR